jgi:ketosteroid isomerase-like protein
MIDMTTIANTTTDIRAKATDLVQLVLSGKALEAFDTYYADDVSMQENTQAPMVGKAANRAREEQFFATIAEFHNAEAPEIIVDGESSVIKWKMDVTTVDGTRLTYEQLALQTWRDGRIVSEQFFYDSASMVAK